MSLYGNSIEERIWNYLYKEIKNPYGVAGLMGNLFAESACDPTTVEMLLIQRYDEDKKKYKSISHLNNWKRPVTNSENRKENNRKYIELIDNGIITRDEFLHPRLYTGKKHQYGFGLAQWSSEGRKAGLYDFAKKKGTSIGNLEMQLEYLVQELEKKYPSVYKVLKSTKSIQEASDIVLIKFEAPTSADKYKVARAKHGQEVYDYIKKNESSSSSSSSSSNNLYSSSSTTNTKSGGTCEVTLKSFVKGNKDNQIKTIQRILNALGYKGKNGKALIVDGEFGDNVEYAITKFQKDKKVQVNNYGTVGAKTWTALLNCA